ncbi:hypothetical protein Q2T46_14920 [Thermoanaerobacterium sp. CMT5567-10]|uniref:hypothetical protein n=1 Tax=Thermoanaerobacterium sp. CMT5567-10 TaxID=3061989 RepID=UPI0026E063A4|nr:hypothetical protein [Thermoanaerobacterium sp. CMT5567-10]WKV08791.1 hypothetical protein Q2T46_14920 [Thermoanaerobacterium sp. CMT5567-10]
MKKVMKLQTKIILLVATVVFVSISGHRNMETMEAMYDVCFSSCMYRLEITCNSQCITITQTLV